MRLFRCSSQLFWNGKFVEIKLDLSTIPWLILIRSWWNFIGLILGGILKPQLHCTCITPVYRCIFYQCGACALSQKCAYIHFKCKIHEEIGYMKFCLDMSFDLFHYVFILHIYHIFTPLSHFECIYRLYIGSKERRDTVWVWVRLPFHFFKIQRELDLNSSPMQLVTAK